MPFLTPNKQGQYQSTERVFVTELTENHEG